MHANIPITQVLVKNKFLYDLDNVEAVETIRYIMIIFKGSNILRL